MSSQLTATLLVYDTARACYREIRPKTRRSQHWGCVSRAYPRLWRITVHISSHLKKKKVYFCILLLRNPKFTQLPAMASPQNVDFVKIPLIRKRLRGEHASGMCRFRRL